MSIDPNHPFSPYGTAGSVFNVIFCGVLLIAVVVMGIVQANGGFFFVAAIACIIEFQFIRVMRASRKRARERNASDDSE